MNTYPTYLAYARPPLGWALTNDYVVSAYAQHNRSDPSRPTLLAAASELVRRDEAQLVPQNVMISQQPHDYKQWSPKQHPQG